MDSAFVEVDQSLTLAEAGYSSLDITIFIIDEFDIEVPEDVWNDCENVLQNLIIRKTFPTDTSNSAIEDPIY